jgi:uncharacterized protein (TIGR03435 family)
MSMEGLAASVTGVLRTPVSDATGIAGTLDFTLKWTPAASGQSAATPNLPVAAALPKYCKSS